MMPKFAHLRGRGGATLMEILVATGVTGVIMAGFLTSFSVLQRSFKAVIAYSISKNDQLRLTDYLAMDLRRALTVTPHPDGEVILSLTLPDYYGSDGIARIPSISGLVANYGDPAAPVSVTYFKNGDSIYRQESGGSTSEIATNIKDVEISFGDLGKVVKTRVAFVPKFRQTSSEESAHGTSVYHTILLRNKRRN